jgi:copper homeostasis protein
VSAASKPAGRVLVEVAVDSVAGAVAAEAGGADRLELCCALGDGGLTPSVGLLRAVSEHCRLPVVAMLRPRPGDFLYDDNEFAVLRADLDALRAAGAGAFVTGVVTADGALDAARLHQLVAAAAPLPVACHRAFDMVRDPLAALDELAQLGIVRVLTSGQRRTAVDGAQRIAECVQRAAGRIAVMAGAGVRAANARELVRATGVRELHLSASHAVDSRMRWRNPEVAMGAPAPLVEYALRCTDSLEVERLVASLRDLA